MRGENQDIGMLTRTFLILLLLLPAVPQKQSEPKLPTGKSRNLAILKHDYEKSTKDVAEIIRLAQELQSEIEENQQFVVSVGSLRKAEKIEKLARSIKNRFKRVQ